MEGQFAAARIVLQSGIPNLWRVLVGDGSSLDDANALAARVRSKVGECLVVRLDSSLVDAAR
jgi:hypothetical protein